MVDELFIGLSEIRVRPLTVASVGTLLDSLELAFHWRFCINLQGFLLLMCLKLFVNVFKQSVYTVTIKSHSKICFSNVKLTRSLKIHASQSKVCVL